jgi:hypothetical protein
VKVVAGKDAPHIHFRGCAIWRHDDGRTLMELISAQGEGRVLVAALSTEIMTQRPGMPDRVFRALVLQRAKNLGAPVVSFNRRRRTKAEEAVA